MVRLCGRNRPHARLPDDGPAAWRLLRRIRRSQRRGRLPDGVLAADHGFEWARADCYLGGGLVSSGCHLPRRHDGRLHLTAQGIPLVNKLVIGKSGAVLGWTDAAGQLSASMADLGDHALSFIDTYGGSGQFAERTLTVDQGVEHLDIAYDFDTGEIRSVVGGVITDIVGLESGTASADAYLQSVDGSIRLYSPVDPLTGAYQFVNAPEAEYHLSFGLSWAQGPPVYLGPGGDAVSELEAAVIRIEDGETYLGDVDLTGSLPATITGIVQSAPEVALESLVVSAHLMVDGVETWATGAGVSADGSFVLSNIRAGEQQIRIWGDGGALTTFALEQPLTPGEVRDIGTIVAPAYTTVSVDVTLADPADADESFWIKLEDDMGEERSSGELRAEAGATSVSHVFGWIPPGTYTLSVE